MPVCLQMGSTHAALCAERGEQCSQDGNDELHNLSDSFTFHKGKKVQKVQKFKSSKVQEVQKVQKFKGSRLTYGLRLSRLTYCLPRTRLIASSLLPLGIAQTSLALLSLNHSLRDSSCKHDSPLAALSVRPNESKLSMALAASDVQSLEYSEYSEYSDSSWALHGASPSSSPYGEVRRGLWSSIPSRRRRWDRGWGWCFRPGCCRFRSRCRHRRSRCCRLRPRALRRGLPGRPHRRTWLS